MDFKGYVEIQEIPEGVSKVQLCVVTATVPSVVVLETGLKTIFLGSWT